MTDGYKNVRTLNLCINICRWRIVVHGGVDGYSRLPVYLHASSNNQAATVLTLFTRAAEEYGLPSRVRCDKGGENYEVGRFMLNHPNRGPGRGSIIAGTCSNWYLAQLSCFVCYQLSSTELVSGV